MKITFNVDINAKKLIRYTGAKRLDKESAQVIINDLAKSAPTALCKVLQGHAYIVLKEDSKNRCFAQVICNNQSIARTDTYTYRTVERVFQKEIDIYNYVDISHIGGDFQKEEQKTCRSKDDILCRIAEIIKAYYPAKVDYHENDEDCIVLECIFACGNIRVYYYESSNEIVLTGLTDAEIDSLNSML